MSFDFGFCNSLHLSLMAATDPSFETEGLIQSCCRDERGICFTGSLSGDSSSGCWLFRCVGRADGKMGRRNSEMNCVS